MDRDVQGNDRRTDLRPADGGRIRLAVAAVSATSVLPIRGTYTRSQLSEADKVAAAAFGRGITRQANGCFALGALVFIALAVIPAAQKNTSGAWEWAALAILPTLLFFWNFRAVRKARKLTMAAPISGAL